MGGIRYSYRGAFFPSGSATLTPAREYPVPLSQIRLAPLFRNGVARPYRLFAAGTSGAYVALRCVVVPAGADEDTGDGNINLGSGQLQVTLTWDGPDQNAIAQSDIDLHVMEPDQTHVYYGRMTGNYGRLDRDDTDGYGPENYYITGTPAPGDTYQVYIRNFDRTRNVNALVRIRTRYGTRVISVRWGTTFEDKNIATIAFRQGGVTITDTSGTPRQVKPAPAGQK